MLACILFLVMSNDMTYKEARVYLDEVSKYGSVLSLDTIRNLLAELNNPQEDLHFIHIAGTNGKGSVLAYTSTVLSEANYRVGRYVSPTVTTYLERIQVDGKMIPEATFAELVEEVKEAIVRLTEDGGAHPTVFDIETAVAFLYFRKKSCDLVVLETGLGGLHDSTNVVKNTEVAAFASISRDHMKFLGDTLEEIAHEKAGIIKPGCSVVSGIQKPEVMEVLKQEAKRWNAPFFSVKKEELQSGEHSLEGQGFQYKGIDKIRLKMLGVVQPENAATACEIIYALQKRGYEISKEALEKGLSKTVWKGRFTCIAQNPVVIIDGAHNENAALRLKETLETYGEGRKVFGIMGVFRDKEYEKIAAYMGPLLQKVFTINLPDQNRRLPAEELTEVMRPYCEAVTAYQVETALDLARKEAGPNDVILAFGSLSYLGQMIELAER